MNPSYVVVFGTRPEVMKLRPVIDALRAREASVQCWLTGQHSDLLAQTADTVRTTACIRETIKLGVAPNGDPHAFSADVRRTVGRRLSNLAHRPDAVIVQGDTASAYGAAMGADDQGIPVAHVEAGVRSHYRTPDPEERFRVAIDAVATYRFAPTQVAASNCLGLPGTTVVTGNTIVDDLREEGWLDDRFPQAARHRRVVITLHRRESWEQLPQLVDALDAVARKHPDIEFLWPMHPNPTVRAAALRAQHIVTIPAIGVHAFRHLLRRSLCAVTDSGGVTEEAATLGVYTLVVRDYNDRPEAEQAGLAQVVGTDPGEVADRVDRVLLQREVVTPVSFPSPVFGDGYTAGRISDVLLSAATPPVSATRP